MAAATTATELGAFDRVDGDACLAQERVGELIPLIGHHHARLHTHHVVAVVPLLALLSVCVAAGGDHAQLDVQRICDDVDPRAVVNLDVHQLTRVIRRTEVHGFDRVDYWLVDRDQVAVTEGEYRIEMHRGAVARHLGGDDM